MATSRRRGHPRSCDVDKHFFAADRGDRRESAAPDNPLQALSQHPVRCASPAVANEHHAGLVPIKSAPSETTVARVAGKRIPNGTVVMLRGLGEHEVDWPVLITDYGSRGPKDYSYVALPIPDVPSDDDPKRLAYGRRAKFAPFVKDIFNYDARNLLLVTAIDQARKACDGHVNLVEKLQRFRVAQREIEARREATAAAVMRSFESTLDGEFGDGDNASSDDDEEHEGEESDDDDGDAPATMSEQLRIRMDALFAVATSSKCRQHLIAIADGHVDCPRHSQFDRHSNSYDEQLLVGPFEADCERLNQLIALLKEWVTGEIATALKLRLRKQQENYVYYVWLPEAIKFAMIAVRGVNDVLAEALLQYDDEHATPEADAALVAQILAPSTMLAIGEGGELRASKSTGSERKVITKRKERPSEQSSPMPELELATGDRPPAKQAFHGFENADHCEDNSPGVVPGREEMETAASSRVEEHRPTREKMEESRSSGKKAAVDATTTMAVTVSRHDVVVAAVSQRKSHRSRAFLSTKQWGIQGEKTKKKAKNENETEADRRETRKRIRDMQLKAIRKKNAMYEEMFDGEKAGSSRSTKKDTEGDGNG